MYKTLEAVIADFEKEAKLPKKGSCEYYNIVNIIIPSAEEIKELDITPIIKNSLADHLTIKTKDSYCLKYKSNP